MVRSAFGGMRMLSRKLENDMFNNVRVRVRVGVGVGVGVRAGK